jgi:hypothetical protein
MKTKEQITELLMRCLNRIYCDTCKHDDSTRCESCSRKSMNWSISQQAAAKIADQIME